MGKIKAIISDSDGTLVNTVYLIRHGQYEAATEYLLEQDVPRNEIPSYEVYESYINKSVGGSTRETFQKTLHLLFKETHEHHLKKINFDDLDKRLIPIQDRLAPLYVHPFHGLTELFSWAGEVNVNIGIFTSGDRRMIMRNFGVSLPALGFSDVFRSDEISVSERFESFLTRTKAVYGIQEFDVVTCEDVTKTKPDPEGILKLMEDLKVTKDEVILLGDHSVDMQAAVRAHIPSIGISHGFGTPAELKEAGAIEIVNDLASIPEVIDMYNKGKFTFLPR